MQGGDFWGAPDRLEMTMASLNSERQFWRRAVRPPLVMTALVPCRRWNRRSLGEPPGDGLSGDPGVSPSEPSPASEVTSWGTHTNDP